MGLKRYEHDYSSDSTYWRSSTYPRRCSPRCLESTTTSERPSRRFFRSCQHKQRHSLANLNPPWARSTVADMILFVPGIESSKPASPLCKMVDKGDNDKPVARDHQARHLNVLKDKRTRGGGLELRHRLHSHHNIDDHACQHRGKYGNLRVSTQFHAAQKKRSEAHSRARSAIQSAVTVDGERRHGVKDASYPLWYLGYE